MPARRKSPRRVLKRRSSGKARRSPSRTYKGVDARLYGMQVASPSSQTDSSALLESVPASTGDVSISEMLDRAALSMIKIKKAIDEFFQELGDKYLQPKRDLLRKIMDSEMIMYYPFLADDKWEDRIRAQRNGGRGRKIPQRRVEWSERTIFEPPHYES